MAPAIVTKVWGQYSEPLLKRRRGPIAPLYRVVHVSVWFGRLEQGPAQRAWLTIALLSCSRCWCKDTLFEPVQISKSRLILMQLTQLTKSIRLRRAADIVDSRKEENLDPNRDKAGNCCCQDLHCAIKPLTPSLSEDQDHLTYRKM